MELTDYGWTDSTAAAWQIIAQPGLQPARVVADFGTSLKVVMPEPRQAELTGKLAHYSDREAVPKVGDWVAVKSFDNGDVVVEAVAPRASELARKMAGNKTVKQVIAANVDIAFVLLALDNDFSVERLTRYLYQLTVSNIKPVIVLNKADKTDDLGGFVAQLQQLDHPIIIAEATTGKGVEEIAAMIGRGRTAILLGSSGVGKSTLTNHLIGHDTQATQDVRAKDDTGRHTTVHRELFVLPGGGLLIDTPGIRELQLWGTLEELAADYSDITATAAMCKYATCQHGSEPGCAIRPALADGTIDAHHYAQYLKMRGELVGLQKRQTVRAQFANRRSAKNLKRRDDAAASDDY